ncbi:aminodeoxychorismate lyase [Desulfuromonas versatilis]|uniref:Endolytic murein transglycosylase n=1 Tax=Desulfuromonas versatilis TaxID=2802975 RepID=A0ABN6DTT2_9BACT|nr:endolytic transglycosylase MltG [Desulfuromonas versatilis]BCR03533.1 aminodeoxychorismate lyase [Desulfuromonas versatilis]
MTRRHTITRAVLAATSFILIIPAVWFGSFLFQPIAPPQARTVTIASGTSFAKVAGILKDEGVIASAKRFTLLARLRGDAGRIKAGDYAFSAPATPGQVLDRLIAGDVIRRQITIIEGMALREIAQRLEAEGFGTSAEFLKLTGDPEFIAGLGIASPTLEGYLFPETYTVVAGISQKRLVELMVSQFQQRTGQELIEAARKRGFTLQQLVTLASIIQKEAGNLAEMPVISAVFHNRLKRGMMLQADPTVIYGIENFDGNLTRKHLETPTPYNTYRMKGLPPTPIASPGEDALRAAAFPADSPHLYFVARGDGTHVFAATLEEHNRNVRRYQLRR